MRTPPNRGDRLRLVGPLPEDPDVPEGSEGIVSKVHMHEGWFQISMDWEGAPGIGPQLMLLDVDPYEVVN